MDIRDLRTTIKEVVILKAALTDKLKGRITQKELETTCLEWLYHYGLKQLECLSPPEITTQITIFNGWDYKKRRRIMEEDSSIKQAVLKYRSRVVFVKYENKTNRRWLTKMIEHFEKKGDRDKVYVIREIEGSHK